ncbi:MAG TPA: thiamine biosynthesis protein ThiS [Gammaproteobacteria bacterium]|nr:thiamine biosynthesis protein ThiS [Gammaproteobacteria bacterium]|tara:strand:+ start:419 stop:616 length:198 start_codon:yes stop_codon:yes gene_type:complete
MQVSVNGQIEEIQAQSLESYLASKLLLGRRIAIELNGAIVPKSQFSSVVLADGDVLEIVNAIGGG